MKEPEEETSLELSYNDDPVCPYCKYRDEEFEMDSGSFPKQDGEFLFVDCQNCGKEYQIIGHIELSYSTYEMKPANPIVGEK
jgi:DNA-directed RNA polymerase subunit RPC12/RpoP